MSWKEFRAKHRERIERFGTYLRKKSTGILWAAGLFPFFVLFVLGTQSASLSESEVDYVFSNITNRTVPLVANATATLGHVMGQTFTTVGLSLQKTAFNMGRAWSEYPFFGVALNSFMMMLSKIYVALIILGLLFSSYKILFKKEKLTVVV